MSNHGKYIVSMGAVARWMCEQAEALGVEIFPGMSCSQLIYREDGSLKGVVAGEFGYEKDGSKGPNYEPGMELHGKYVFLAEGARGSLSQIAMKTYNLRDGVEPQKFGLGMKESWEIKPENHQAGKVYHSIGWPLGIKRGGGSFLYHAEKNQVFLGMIVDLNYKNPHIYPYMEFQRWKHHPDIAAVLEGGKRISYGARVVTKGGYQSIPHAAFPGGALLGCAVGLVNLPRIKGNQNAMLSGIAAAEAANRALKARRSADTLSDYDHEIRDGAIGADLRPVRNVAALNGRFGPFLGGMLMGGLDMWMQTLFKFSPFGTLSHRKNDAKSTGKAADHKPIDYPKPDGVLSFDRLTNVSFTNTYHGENQPNHLKLIDQSIPIDVNLPVFDEPAQRYCPAGVYEVVIEEGKDPSFVINSQNCIHCKTCDLKDPSENIVWTVPEGGGGPNYADM